MTSTRTRVGALCVGALVGCSDDVRIVSGATEPDRPSRPEVSADAGPDRDAAIAVEMPVAESADASLTDSGVPTQAVALQFVARMGERELRCGDTYVAQGSTGALVQPSDLRLFVQDVRLVRDDGALVPVNLDERFPWQTSEVALLDFEDASGACVAGNADRNDLITGRVPAGRYSGIAFSNGVPEALNHADPATLPPPLQAGGLSWGWLLGYKFFVAELAEVPDADAGVADAAVPGFSLLHLGSTACTGNPGAGEVACALPNRNQIRLDDFDPASSSVVIDVGALFSETDLRQQSQCHSAGEPCEALFGAVGLDFEDGLPRGEQRVYRVE